MDVVFKSAKLEAGKLIIDIPPDQRGSVMNFIRNMKNCLYHMEVKQFRKKRSLDANAYCWVLINNIADILRITPKEIYRQAILNIGGNYEVIPIKAEAADHFKKIWEAQGIGWPCIDMGRSKIKGYRNLRAYYGSSTYDTRQMSQLIDNLVQDCKALGVETKPHEDIESLLRSWQ